ncbi:NAD-binding protein [Alicyclobacillus sp. ALC3]|uniref:NAD-binding protein n=1 Tax=Alicyclobacillus sp. ALC3 TaxID=2796143 RepID=UPI00237944EE|nr:NAD-binding protein [Alicyclobacillus sp. ALC3]WDL98677.1 hypothetical protein JC200_08455 [Alicyclobacillus sp. ALC3]
MLNLLLVSFSREGTTYYRRARQSGMAITALDCVETYHKRLSQWYGDNLLQTLGRRKAVSRAVAAGRFDAAVVHEDTDYVHTALITQSLREAGVYRIVLVTSDSTRAALYRRLGAHRVIVAASAEEAWPQVLRVLPSLQTA